MAKYLVTGGAGFIGSHLVKGLLESGHTIRLIDTQSGSDFVHAVDEVECVQGDINDVATIESVMQDVNGCYHLASRKPTAGDIDEAMLIHLNNLSGTVNVLQAAGKFAVPVVYASSSDVYGDNADWSLREQ